MNPAVSTLRAILNPRSIAVIGASSDPAKFGGRVMHFLLQHGYRGRIIPVHPTATEVLGIPAVAQITGTGDPVDVCLLALPSAHLATALDCGALTDQIKPFLEARKICPIDSLVFPVAQPRVNGHVRNAVAVARDEFAQSQLLVHHAV